VDDVITAGTSVRESVDIIRTAGAQPVGVLIALDRMEKGQNNISAIEEVKLTYDMPVLSIITLSDIIEYLTDGDSHSLHAIKEYQRLYGV
jgi:orotate phosphoribosyltransferase